MNQKQNLSFYLYLQRTLLENCEPDKTIDFEKLKWKIINIRIPKKMIYVLMKEMEQLELGKLINKTVFQIRNINKCERLPRVIDYAKN